MVGTTITAALLQRSYGMCLHFFSIFSVFILSKTFVSFLLFIVVRWAFCASTLFAHARTCSIVTSLLSSVLVSSLIICTNMSLSFNHVWTAPLLSISLYFYYTAATVSLSIHSSAFSYGCLINLRNCNGLMVSLYCGFSLLFNVVNRPPLVLHLSCSVWVNVSKNCRLFRPSHIFMIAILSVNSMV